MIQAVCGHLGSGKTLYCVWQIHQLALQGRPVATNIDLTPQHPAYDYVVKIGGDDAPIVGEDGCFFNYMPPGVDYVIDEGDVWFDCQEYHKIATQVRLYFKQMRKREDRMIMTIQAPENLWNRIRRLCQDWVWCHKDTPGMDGGFRGLAARLVPQKYHRFSRSHFSASAMLPRQFQRGGHFRFHEAAEMFTWYETKQLLGDCSFERASASSVPSDSSLSASGP